MPIEPPPTLSYDNEKCLQTKWGWGQLRSAPDQWNRRLWRWGWGMGLPKGTVKFCGLEAYKIWKSLFYLKKIQIEKLGIEWIVI